MSAVGEPRASQGEAFHLWAIMTVRESFLLLLSLSLSSAAIRRGNRYIDLLSREVNWAYTQNHWEREREKGELSYDGVGRVQGLYLAL